MAYDDDDDLFDHEFDFVDDDDDETDEDDSDVEDDAPKPKPKPRKSPAGRGKTVKDKAKEPAKGRGKAAPKGKDSPKEPKEKDKPAEKLESEAGGAARGPKRSKPAGKRDARRADDEESIARAEPAHGPPPPPPVPALERAPVGYILGDEPLDDDDESESAAQPPAPAGPQADHLVHIYQYGELSRTIARKFTDEEAVSFAEEYTRSNKAYGRYAVAMPEDEEPSPTFAGAARG